MCLHCKDVEGAHSPGRFIWGGLQLCEKMATGLTQGRQEPEKPSSPHPPTKGPVSIRVAPRNKTAILKGFSMSSYLKEKRVFPNKIGFENSGSRNLQRMFVSLMHFSESLLC